MSSWSDRMLALLDDLEDANAGSVSNVSCQQGGHVRIKRGHVNNNNKIDRCLKKSLYTHTDTVSDKAPPLTADITDTTPVGRQCDNCNSTAPIMLAMEPGDDQLPWFLCSSCWRLS
jgi:hypothetical protein